MRGNDASARSMLAARGRAGSGAHSDASLRRSDQKDSAHVTTAGVSLLFEHRDDWAASQPPSLWLLCTSPNWPRQITHKSLATNHSDAHPWTTLDSVGLTRTPPGAPTSTEAAEPTGAPLPRLARQLSPLFRYSRKARIKPLNHRLRALVGGAERGCLHREKTLCKRVGAGAAGLWPVSLGLSSAMGRWSESVLE